MTPGRRTILRWCGLGIAGLSAATLLGWWRVDGPGSPSRPEQRAATLPLSFGAMDFRLTDHRGNAVVPADWIGRPTMVFFGFTYCPEVCPTTMTDIAEWLEALGPDAAGFQAVFITVDPARDTVDVLADYVTYFHPAISGHTGDAGQIDKAAQAFRVQYRRIALDDGYTMDHSAGVFVYDARGRFVSLIDYHEARDMALPKLRNAL